ncbi:MAG: HAMP domain-containing protein [Deltaproteobacteria bacterium]|nr:HAMP domain-containing protein [Deltaproteobacteria bacterium]
MLYVAYPVRTEGFSGVIRAALPLEEANALLARLRMYIVLGGLVGLIVAVLISAVSAHYISRTLRTLVASARAIGTGRDRRRLAVRSEDELGGLAGSINLIAEELERHVAELAEERDRSRAVLEAMGDAVLAFNGDQQITLVNQAAHELLRLPSDPRGKTLIEVLRIPALHDFLAGNGEGPRTVEFELPGEERRIVLARVAPFRSGEGGCSFCPT